MTHSRMLSMPPEEVLAQPKRTKEYIAWRAETDLRAPYRVAPEFLRGTKADAEFDADEAPLLVFINARSGGRVGPELAAVLARALGRSQVFDLAHHRPDAVLARVYANIAAREARGDARATRLRRRLRVLACGGDGTVAWLLKCIAQLGLEPAPPVAVMPLGTGNDLSRSFRWGAEFERAWVRGRGGVYAALQRVADAAPCELDRWRLRLALPSEAFRPTRTYAMEDVAPGAADAAAAAAASGSGSGSAAAPAALLEGQFWNYFSVGADAQAAFAFHHLRDRHPRLAPNRLANQAWYGAFTLSSGWFCGAVPPVSRFGSVEVLRRGGGKGGGGKGELRWEPLALPAGVCALVLVNLQSYGGGRNIWGEAESRTRSWAPPAVDDGLIEVVGFTNGFHAAAVMGSGGRLVRGRRLAQAAGVRVSLRDVGGGGGADDAGGSCVYMQLDGEPWQQPVPAGGAGGPCVTLEVVHAGTSRLLRNVGDADAAAPEVCELVSPAQAAAYLSADAAEEEEAEAVDAFAAGDGAAAATSPLAAARPAPLAVPDLELPAAAHRGAVSAGGALQTQPSAGDPAAVARRSMPARSAPGADEAAAALAGTSAGGAPPPPAPASASSPAGSSVGGGGGGRDSIDSPSAVAVIEITGGAAAAALTALLPAAKPGAAAVVAPDAAAAPAL